MWTVQGLSRHGILPFKYQFKIRIDAEFSYLSNVVSCIWIELVNPNGEVVLCN